MTMLAQSLCYHIQWLFLQNQALTPSYGGKVEDLSDGPFRMAPMVPMGPDQANDGSTGHAMHDTAAHLFKHMFQGLKNI